MVIMKFFSIIYEHILRISEDTKFMMAYIINENISVQHIRSISLPLGIKKYVYIYVCMYIFAIFFLCNDYYIKERLAPIPNQTLCKIVEDCLT